TSRPLGDAHSVAQVVSHRITGRGSLPAPHASHTIPTDIAPLAARHLEHLDSRIGDRRRVLGERLAADTPRWALDAFGLPPADDAARRMWQERVSLVAAHREATGWTDEHRPIGPMPGLSATERRASYVAAWDALGRPEAGLSEAAMSDGRLRAR